VQTQQELSSVGRRGSVRAISGLDPDDLRTLQEAATVALELEVQIDQIVQMAQIIDRSLDDDADERGRRW
jgi:hypothetical protein